MDRKRIITKSKYINGLKCFKLLWIDCNDRSRIPEPDIGQQHIFDQGSVVGELAKKLYPEGVDIPYEREGFLKNIEDTNKLLSTKKVLYEAGILVDDIYARVDILKPADGGKWDIIEVKSSTGMKEVYYHDVAFQKYCCESKGLEIARCFLMHIDNRYVRQGEIDPEGFFTLEDITDELEAYLVGIENRLNSMREIILKPECPEMDIGPYCNDPYSCAMIPQCWKDLAEDNIFTLYNYGGVKCFPLYEEGIKTIKDIPEVGLGVKQLIQKRCEDTGKVHIDKDSIRSFLEEITYPVYFMDFETINPAVPLFDGTRPYQMIPFQFSVHVQHSPGGEAEHYGFLSKDMKDPRERFLVDLKNALGETGTVMVYNRGFEERILNELADSFPEYREWVQKTKMRIVDLLLPFRGFAYYNPLQHGSASIKKVLPAVTGKGYEDMDISGGGDASALYFNVTYGNAETKEKEKVYSDLEKYCGLDTEGMVWIVDELGKMTRG